MVIMKDDRFTQRSGQRIKKVAENKDTGKMGGLSEERSKKGRGSKVERKGQQQGAIEKITKVKDIHKE